MAQSLLKWAKENLTVRPDGITPARVRLQANESNWATWYPDQWSSGDSFDASIEQWCREVEETIAGLCEEWPARHVSAVLVAEDEALNVLSQYVKGVRGRNKESSAKLFGSENMAQAQAMDSLAKTMERVLMSAASNAEQMAASQRTMAQHNEMLLQQLQYEKLKQLEAPKVPEPDPGVQEFQRQFFQQLPAIIELGIAFLRERGGDSGAIGRAAAQQAARAAAGAVALQTPPNGENIQ